MATSSVHHVPDCSTSSGVHPFGHEVSVTQNQLLTAFFNHLYLGQWELASACATSLENLQGSDNHIDIRAVLRAIIKHPHDISLGLDSISSVHQLARLASLLLKQEARQEEDLSADGYKDVEFRLLLYLSNCDAGPAVLQEVYMYYEAVQLHLEADHETLVQKQMPLPHLSKDCFKFLLSSLSKDVTLGHTIIQRLLLPNQHRAEENNLSLHQLYVTCLRNCISSLESSDSGTLGEKEQTVQLIHSLLNYLDPPVMLVPRLYIEELFTSLLRLASHNPGLICEASLTAVLIGRDSDTLLRTFLKVQSSVRWECAERDVSISHPQLKCMCPELRIYYALSRMDDREAAWRNLLHWVLENDQHVLSKIVELSLTLIREKMYDELSNLLQPSELAALRPLILLLGWGHVESCFAAERLLHTLWRKQVHLISSEDDLLQQACQRLHQDVQLIQWCLEQVKPLIAKYDGDHSLEQKATAMFQGADSHSVLRLLYHFTNLSKIDPMEGFHILNSTPQLESMQSNGNEAKTVRFADDKKQIDQKRDCTIYRSFLAIGNVMSALMYSANPPHTTQGIEDKGASTLPTISVMSSEGQDKARSGGTMRSDIQRSLGDNNLAASKSGNFEDENKSWQTCVVGRLRAAREHLLEIVPLTYRVEILENLFSVLFARYEDIQTAESDVVMSDSGGEEGHVDEEWNNMSFNTSLESVESPVKEGSLLTEFTFSTIGEKTSSVTENRPSMTGLSKDRNQSASEATLTPTLLDKTDVLESADVQRLKYGKRTSSETTNSLQSNLNQFGYSVNKVGFLTNRRFMQELLTMLKECMEDVNTAKLANIVSKEPSQGSSDDDLKSHLVTSVPQAHLAQHIAQLTKRINEARWRFQLVSSHQANVGKDDDEEQYDEIVEEEVVIRNFFEAWSDENRGGKKRKRTSSKQSQTQSRSASGWSSSEPGSGNHSTHSQTCLSADPVSTGNSSGNERRKRRKHKRSTSQRGSISPKPHHHHQDSSIVAQMLASEDTLLRMCLRRGNFAQAQQVIKIFDMKDKPEVSEVHFASYWQQAVSKLKILDKSKEGSSSNTFASSQQPRTGGIRGSIASIAAAGIASLSLTGVVDDLLNNATLPILPQLDDMNGGVVAGGSPGSRGGSNVMWQQLKAINISAMVVFDLACTASHSWKTCSELLEVVMSRLKVATVPERSSHIPEVKLTSPSQLVSSPKVDRSKSLLGIRAFIEQLYNLIKPVSSSSSALIRPDVFEYFQRCALEALITVSAPLDPSTLRAHVNFVLEVRRGLELLKKALHAYQADEDCGLAEFSFNFPDSPKKTSSPKRGAAQPSPKQSPIKTKQKVSEIHRSVQQLLIALDKNMMPSFMMAFPKNRTSDDQPVNPANYLLTLYNHLSVLASLAQDAQGWQPGSERQLKVERDLCQNPFSILGESPSLLLGRLMFANQIPPVRLESVASELKLNLVQIIMQSCCPAIPMLPHSTIHQTPTRDCPGDYVTVLNEGGVAGEWPHPVRRPCVVIEELLNKIISLMMKHISGDGSDAAFELSSASAACTAPEYWDIVMSTRELMHVDLDLLQTNEDKLCFFTNLLNLMLAHGALHHAALQTSEKGSNSSLGHTRHHSLGRGTTNPASIMLTPPGINSGMVLDQLVYLSSMAYRVGQMGVISAFDLHFVILRSNLPVPLVYGDILQHRLHALGEDDPWLKYIPSPDSRITFVSCNGSASSPRLRVLTGEDLDEQLTLAMQNHLEAGVRVDEKLNQIVIPQSLEWFRKDFTGSTLPADIHHGNIYMGLLSVIIPHVSQYLGDKLENYTMRYLPRHIELESSAELAKGGEGETGQPADKKPPLQRSNSMRFKIVVATYDHTFRYRFSGPTDSAAQPSARKRRLSVPDNFDSSGLGCSLKDESPTEPPFSMTESTLMYLHSKSKLVASLAGVVSASIGESTDAFARDKSIDEDMLPSSVGSPASLVFEDTFGSDRTYDSKLSTLTKVLQHLAGYPIMQYYIQSFFSEVVSKAGSSRGNECLNEMEVRASLLADIRCKEIQDLLKEAVELLISSCKWEAVLRLVDTIRCVNGTACYDAIRDFAAYCAGNQVKGIQTTASTKPAWQCLLTIRNKTLRDRAVLASLDSLPIEDALELLECCVLDDRKDSPVNSVLNTKLQQLKMYRKITFYAMQYTPPPSLEVLQGRSMPSDTSEVIRPLCTWQDVQDASKTSPDNVLKLLISASDFDLANDWAELHGVIEDYQQTIQINQLEHLLYSSSNNLQVYQMLDDAGSIEETVSVCTQLLDSQKIALPSVVFLVQYLLHNCFDELSLERAGKLHDISIGAKVLLCLPERVRGEYQHLMSRPDLLLEQLLMNLKMNLASDVQATLQEELQASQFPSASLSEKSINTLISKYAREAIKIPVALLNTSMSDTDSALNQSFALTSYASALSPLGLVSALKGRQFLASMRGRAPSPSPSSVSSSSSIPVPERRRVSNRGPSPGLTSPGPTSPPSHQTSRDGSSSQNPDQLLSPPSGSTRPPVLPEVLEKPKGVSLEGGELPAVPPTRDQWVPDDKVSNCMVCQDRFSMFNRRHHCRRCGRVVCWKCSQLRAVVDGYGDTPVRICDQCYERFIAPRSYGTPQALEQRIKEKMSGGRGSGGSGSMPAASRSFTPSQTPELGMGGEGLTDYGPVTEWRLSLDEEYCSMVREDFYYEQAPSTSLCLSILELHSDPGTCGHLILQLCQRLSEYLRPIRPGEPNTEVDYSLILSMMRTLLLNSKLKFLGSGDSASLELCDTYLGHVDLLNMFVSSNCTDIPSIQQLTKIDTARRIRDKLVLSERLSLAMEVSTKCGLDPGAVWAAWGLSCLQAGDYEGAREKLSKILKTPTDKNQTQGPNKLLQEIIKILESSSCQTVKVQDILTLPASSIKDFIAQPYKSVPEYEKLSENPALKECVHYIQTYSSHLTAVQFYMRHGLFQRAVSCILQQQCSSEVFLEGLLVPCIKEGQFSQLQEQMLRVDPSLVKWHHYLTASCRHVNRLGWSHILYQMQLFMKDFVRAAMTCIKFFQAGATSYSDLFERLHHVNRAKDHMTAVTDDKQWGSVPRPSPSSPSSRTWGGATGESNIRLTLTPSELTKHLNTISLQIEVTTFLHRHLGKNSLVPPTSPTQANPPPPAGLARKQSVVGGGAQPSGLPTLFGSSMEKADVVHKVLLAGTTIQEGFQLAFKIIQDFRLAETKIYSRAGRRLSLLKKFNEVKLLLKCHKDTGLASKESCDEILDACVRALVGDKTQVKGAEELIKLMQGDTSKINAYILIGRLRQAYLLAVKGEREDDVRRIAMAAEQAEASGVKLKAICDQWLRDYEAKRRNAEQTKEVLARSKAVRY